MKKFSALLVGLGLLAGLLTDAAGTDPTVSSPAPSRAGKEVGRVLVLDSERTVTGEIERVGDQYRIKRLIGETYLPADRVLKLCASLEEAYNFLQHRANLNDPDERTRLAEWCRQHGLKSQAVVEAKAALALKPSDERLRRLVRYLEESLARGQTPNAAAPPREEPQPRVEVSADSLHLFTSRVQPILLNACASCHIAGRGGSFQLQRVYGSGVGSRKSIERNLASVLAQVNPNDPRTSRLLTKAVSLHAPGMSNAPLKGRNVAAYRSIEEWLQVTLENNPQLREQAAAATAPYPNAGSRPDSFWGQDRSPLPAPPAAPPAVAPSPTVPPAAAPVPTRPEPAAAPPAKPVPLDPADPDGFNREFHPDKPGKDAAR